MQSALQAQGIEKSKLIVPALDDDFELSASGKAIPIPVMSRRLDTENIEKPDWHNDLAQLTLDIRSILEQTSSNKQRSGILKKLRKLIGTEIQGK